ncbi:phage portal protein [Pseudomonas brassicacearum]|uniref:phage portal protein n=1 Tax=Pseudomonas brassicacearum TaxID=930166 RepID=UPI001294F657|nr:phage portal protein [Pseudomonas brassicacearum]QGA51457.1 phage portal protein [Pseudomonas brassicacearum]
MWPFSKREGPADLLMREAIKVARASVDGQQIVAQGGGGGVETRWRGASRMLRSMASWIPGLGSPRRDFNQSERRMLVARSRDAMRNHLIARAAITRLRTNVVGTGLVCRAQVDHEALGLTEEQADELNGRLDRLWSLYADDPRECDAEATLNHYQLQALVLVSSLVAGDVLVASPDQERPGCVFSTRLQLIESDRVGNPNGGMDRVNLVDGVEFDSLGAPVAYHVCTGYPGEHLAGKPLIWERLTAFGEETGRRRVLHVLADKERPGQKRGAPYLAPVLEPLQKLERYSSAELMAAVISAMFTVFIKKSSDFPTGNLPMTALADERPEGDDTTDGELALGEGAVIDLGVGEEPVVANPGRPNAQFDPFFTAVVKEIGAALELPLEELLLHYSSSYSAARAAMLQAWRFYSLRRWWLACDFCQPSRELIIDEAVARGLIDLPGYGDPAKRKAYCQAIWIGPARGAIDELKEANAAGKRIEIGVSNETLETAAMTGEPWQQVFRQRVREVEQRRAKNLQALPKGGLENPPDPKSEED